MLTCFTCATVHDQRNRAVAFSHFLCHFTYLPGSSSVTWHPTCLQGTASLTNIQFRGTYNISQFSIAPTDNSTSDYWDYGNAGIYFMRYFYYNQYLENENEPYFAAIYNQNGGTLNATNLYIGIGAHFSVLYNQGSASINGLHTEFSRNGSAYYDRWNLRLYTAITNDFGALYITNSNIVGADTSLIDINGGTVRLSNVTLARSMMGITTYYSAESILMDNVNLYEIGKFYASFGAALYHYDPARSDWNVDDPEAVYLTTPCHLSADSVTIQNSKFSYIDSFGVLMISEYGLNDPEDNDVDIKSVKIVNNEIALKLIAGDEYDGYSYRTDFSALSSMLNESFRSMVTAENVANFINASQMLGIHNSTGLIVVENGYEFVIGNNDILVDAAFSGDSYLYIDSGSADGCISGNDLVNIDIVVQSGNIKSCKHYGLDSNQVK